MRSLTATLQAAQSALAVLPALRCTRTRATGYDARYVVPQTPITIAGGAASTDPACVCASGGVCTVFALRGGFVTRTTLTGAGNTLAGPAGAFATADTLIAAAQRQSTVAVLTSSPGATSATINLSTDGGATFPTIETHQVSNGSLSQIACAFAPDGRLFIVAASAGAAALCVTVRTATNTYTATSTSPDAGNLANATAVACAYSVAQGPGDLVILSSGDWSAEQTHLALSLFGDGGLLTTATWQEHKDLLGYAYAGAANAHTIPQLGGMALADTLRATHLETFTNVGITTWSRNHTESFASPGQAALAAASEPVPLTAETAPLLPAYDPSSDRLYYAHAAAAYCCPAPATADLSARVLTCDRQDTESQCRATVLLDNADGALTTLAQDPEAIGDRYTLDFGYIGATGAELTAAAPLWLTALSCSAEGGQALATAHLSDAWHLLAALAVRRPYTFTGLTVLQLLQGLLARAGIPLPAPQSPSAALARTPDFTVHPAQTLAHAVHALLDTVPELLRFTASGATLVLPLPADTPLYSYTPAAHPVLASRLNAPAPSITRVLVFGRANAGDHAPSLLAEAVDTAAAARFGDLPFAVTDMQLTSVADAQTRAGTALRKAQLLADTGEIATLPNAGIELFDVISVTDPAFGLAGAARRVRALHTHYDTHPDGGVYTQSVGLMQP